ncbi:MAG: polysaccharide deacetylase family protein [bacterium]
MKVPILLYHEIISDEAALAKVDVRKRPYCLSRAQFQEQMTYLQENNFKTIRLHELVEALEREEVPEGKSVVITFDDGCVSDFKEAYPVLKRLGQRAVFFVTAGAVGDKGMLNWDQIKEMLDGGMEIGSHTLTHPFMAALDEEELKYELAESKRVMEEHLEREIDLFSSPTGYHHPAVGKIAKMVGYQAVCINQIGGVDLGTDPFALKRLTLKRHHRLAAFKAFVELKSGMICYHRAGQILRNMAKRTLGVKGYEPLRKALLRLKGVVRRDYISLNTYNL